MATAKEMAEKARRYSYTIEDSLGNRGRYDKDCYTFTPKLFDAFCEQLCREQRKLDEDIVSRELGLLASIYSGTINHKIINNENIPDWGQKGGE